MADERLGAGAGTVFVPDMRRDDGDMVENISAMLSGFNNDL